MHFEKKFEGVGGVFCSRDEKARIEQFEFEKAVCLGSVVHEQEVREERRLPSVQLKFSRHSYLLVDSFSPPTTPTVGT